MSIKNFVTIILWITLILVSTASTPASGETYTPAGNGTCILGVCARGTVSNTTQWPQIVEIKSGHPTQNWRYLAPYTTTPGSEDVDNFRPYNGLHINIYKGPTLSYAGYITYNNDYDMNDLENATIKLWYCAPVCHQYPGRSDHNNTYYTWAEIVW